MLLFLSAALGSGRRAEAGIIFTAPPEAVAQISSHVGVFDWIPDTRRFRVVTWLRGTWPTKEIEVHGLSPHAENYLQSLDTPHRLSLFARETVHLTGRVALFLEALDGRLYHTGMRRYGGIGGAHASVQFLSTEGLVLGLHQQMNPGPPTLASLGAKSEAAWIDEIRGLLENNPYAPPGPTRPSVPEAHRASFFAALGATIDWYQGGWESSLPGWRSNVGTADQIAEAADRLKAWMAGVPKEGRLAGLDALFMLAEKVQGGGPDARRALAVAHEMLPTLDALAVRKWVLDELEYGGYYVNRTELARLAKALGPEVYEEALRVLEGWVERTDVNVGTAAFYTLRSLGHGDRADAAQSRREERTSKPSAK